MAVCNNICSYNTSPRVAIQSHGLQYKPTGYNTSPLVTIQAHRLQYKPTGYNICKPTGYNTSPLVTIQYNTSPQVMVMWSHYCRNGVIVTSSVNRIWRKQLLLEISYNKFALLNSSCPSVILIILILLGEHLYNCVVKTVTMTTRLCLLYGFFMNVAQHVQDGCYHTVSCSVTNCMLPWYCSCQHVNMYIYILHHVCFHADHIQSSCYILILSILQNVTWGMILLP